jgi:hypothetical protein
MTIMRVVTPFHRRFRRQIGAICLEFRDMKERRIFTKAPPLRNLRPLRLWIGIVGRASKPDRAFPASVNLRNA